LTARGGRRRRRGELRQPRLQLVPAAVGDVGAVVRRPQLAQLAPGRRARLAAARERTVQLTAAGVDRLIVAAGDRPAGDVVLVLLLDRYGMRGRLDVDLVARLGRREEAEHVRRQRRRADRASDDRL